MTDHVVTARGGSISHPYILAMERVQRDRLVEIALRDDPGFTGVEARTHSTVSFYVWDRPVGTGQGAPRKFLQVGFYAKFGGVYFYDDPRPSTDPQTTTDEDWGWIALRPSPIEDPPIVYFDQDSRTQFSPAAVMPLDEVREVVLEWCNTGERPSSVQWLTVNSLRWKLTDAGDIAPPEQQPA